MNKDLLKIFLSVYAHRGFDWPAFHNKRSADEVRRDMQALEADIGQKLFEEAANGRVTKTEAARVFAPIAQRIVHLMDAADEKFAVIDSENDTDVQLAATADIGGLLVSRALRAFEAQSTGVEVKHAIYSHSDVREKVLAGEAAIGLQYHASREAELNVVPVLNERVVPVCAPDHPLAGTRLDSYDALQDAADIGFGEIHLGFRSGEGLLTRPIHKMFTAFCVMHGRSFIVDHTPSLLRFAETGKLIAFLPDWRIKAQLEDGALVTIELDEPPIIHRLRNWRTF